MSHLLPLLPVLWPWLVLIAAQLVMLSGNRGIALTLLAAFGALVLMQGFVSAGAALIVVLGLLGAGQLRRLSGVSLVIGHVAFILWCLALALHLLPGAHNPLILDQVQAGPESRPFTMYINLDKPMIVFAVVLAWPAMLTARRVTAPTPVLIGLGMLPALLATALLFGAVHNEPGLPEWWLVFALSNLFLTCLTEEAFFRGYLQSALAARFGPIAGIAAASLLFGLAHAAGGALLVVFAGLLGLACGLGYFATGRLWVPVLMHFGFNMAHLLLFTYPGPA
ncbi:MAG: CPBP family intramembrane glutamic endopeptidase [Tateyamaria sp.]|uniref:CPBP family intramembrane glutamic endopeptidase n=1 Tax=Alphaproteobacteria TaxID=28211 RepID=UPI00326613FA